MKRNEASHNSNQKNPNNPAHQKVQDNRTNQLNPNNAEYQKRSEQKSPKAP
ncbi:hypothetical protein [Niveibacterium terrae]|uniref:hypothetical protein n=1 Tax=Niveibacterium terrae TaxID=3373598 RepID=UPI003A9278D5